MIVLLLLIKFFKNLDACDGSVSEKSCLLRYGDYVVIIQAIPDDFLNLNASLNLSRNDYDMTLFTKQSDRWPNKLDFKLIKLKNQTSLNYAVNKYFSI